MLGRQLELRYDAFFPIFRKIYTDFQEKNCVIQPLSGYDLENLIYSKILAVLTTSFKEDGLVVEDFDSIDSKNSFTWFCDPIDGTSNMNTGTSFFSTALSLIKDNQEIVLSFILDLNQGLLYIAKEDKNTIYSFKEKEWIVNPIRFKMKKDEYVLIGRMFGHLQHSNIEPLKDVWWELASCSNSYRQLGSIALQMVLDGSKRNIILFTVEFRWFDVLAALHILKNIGYSFMIARHTECLIIFHPSLEELPVLKKIQQKVTDLWEFFPLNTLEIGRI